MGFFIEVLINGLLVGIMYALVAMGFALIYKASDVFNFAMGDFCLFAGLALVGFLEMGWPVWLALLGTLVVMRTVISGPGNRPVHLGYGRQRIGHRHTG
jgi:branched-chain amino acid transport system permease protein